MEIDLSHFQPSLIKRAGELYILDKVRQKHFVLTPEEWVRQGIIHYLEERGYPLALMQIERGIAYPHRLKRPDVVIYDRAGEPFLLVECKAPYIALQEDTWAQAHTYNWVVQAPYVAITNGTRFYAYDVGRQAPLDDLPAYPL